MTTLKVLMNHSTRGDITMGYVRPSEGDLLHWAEGIEGAILACGDSDSHRRVVPFARKA
jgi:hypothetical protein